MSFYPSLKHYPYTKLLNFQPLVARDTMISRAVELVSMQLLKTTSFVVDFPKRLNLDKCDKCLHLNRL